MPLIQLLDSRCSLATSYSWSGFWRGERSLLSLGTRLVLEQQTRVFFVSGWGAYFLSEWRVPLVISEVRFLVPFVPLRVGIIICRRSPRGTKPISFVFGTKRAPRWDEIGTQIAWIEKHQVQTWDLIDPRHRAWSGNCVTFWRYYVPTSFPSVFSRLRTLWKKILHNLTQ